jgi:DNA modification methylase
MMSDRWAVHLGDCREVMEAMEPESIDSIVSDPPYGLSFMGKGWDHGVPGVEFWEAALRVAKPGAHLLAFGGTRTYHRLAVAIEDAGWEIRDCVMWVYAQGFPKSHDVSKAIDREAGAEREKRWKPVTAGSSVGTLEPRPWLDEARKNGGVLVDGETPATEAAKQWQGWGTALKPAYEPIIVARKPLRGTVAGNVLEWGTGGINVDGCRVGMSNADRAVIEKATWVGRNLDRTAYGDYGTDNTDQPMQSHPGGRWPANFMHDGSQEVTDLLGDAARFFYCPKASKADRDEGCEGMELKQTVGGGGMNDPNGDDVCGKYGSVKSPARNHHPTVKPTALMRYLCRLVTPPNGLVFDPFTGSGSTGKAAMLEGLRFVGAELSEEYIEIARARIGHAAGKTRQKELALA